MSTSGDERSKPRVGSSPTRCPYCHADIATDRDDWVACRGCLARHHDECWREGGRCATCGETTPLEARRGPPGALAEAERPAARASLKEVSRTVDGVWAGRYWQGDRAVSFEARMSADGRSFTGSVTEPNMFGRSSAAELHARIEGMILDGGAFRFTKTYDGRGGASHSVIYEGTVAADGLSASGQWTISGCLWTSLSGAFSMERRPG